MYTVEFDFDRTKIIIMDDTGSKEDLRVTLLEDAVFIEQYDEKQDAYINIKMTPKMWDELSYAMNSPEGAFLSKRA